MITKVLSSVSIALIVAVGTAEPAAAEPSPFSVLSCNCENESTFLKMGATPSDLVDDGIQSGLAELQGISD